MKVLAGNSNKPLAEAICAYLKMPLIKASVRRFADLDTWKHFLYALLRFPLGMTEALIAAGVWSVAFAMIAAPGYDWLLPRLKGRRGLTAATILSLLSLLVVLPFVLFLGVVASQAVRFTEMVKPWITEQVEQRDQIGQHLIEQLPVLEWLRPYQAQVTEHAADIAGKVGAYLAASLSSVATVAVRPPAVRAAVAPTAPRSRRRAA